MIIKPQRMILWPWQESDAEELYHYAKDPEIGPPAGWTRHAFEDLGMRAVWCGYYDGNNNSKRVQEKLGFTYHHTCKEVDVPLMNEIRVGHTNFMTKESWENFYFRR